MKSIRLLLRSSIAIIAVLIALATIAGIAIYNSTVHSVNEPHLSNAFSDEGKWLRVHTPKHMPLPLYKNPSAKVLSLREFLDIAKSMGITIYLPTYVPHGLKVSAVWWKPPTAIVVYSDKGYKLYVLGNLTIEIDIAMGKPWFEPTPENLSKLMEVREGSAKLMIINNIPMLIYERAPLTDPIAIKAFGPYCHLVLFWIESGNYTLRYTICAVKPITIHDLIEILKSIKPVTPITKSYTPLVNPPGTMKNFTTAANGYYK